jgi:colanic acid biosynthesis glycosyl transferase WcaI
MTAHRGDVLFLRTPPLQLGLTGFMAKKLKKARVLLNVQDIHPDLSIESGILKNPAAVQFAKALEKWVYGISDHIVVISEGFKQNLLAKGVDPKKLSVIPNWVDTDFLRPLSKENSVSRKYGLSDRFVLMYSGTISISSNLAMERILEAAKLLQAADDVHIAIVGEGLKKEGLQKRAADLGLKNVSFLPFQPYGDLPDLLASSDVLLVPLDKEKSQLSVPSKLYNFMAAGRPIFGLATPDSEVAAIIRDTRCGVSAAPDKPEEIASAILTLRNSRDLCRVMALNARRYVVENFAKPKILSQYEAIIKSIAA